eukprot:4752874-Pyramimonas_sp.AAC.1
MRSIALGFGDDLRNPKRRKEVLQELEVKQPKVVMMPFPCSPWSNLTYFKKDPLKVRERQFHDRPFLRFVRDVA